MRFIFISSLIFILFAGKIHASQLVFEHVNIIPMDKKQVLYNQRVVVENEKIIAIEPSSEKRPEKTSQVIDCRGKFMLPGLSDTHYHQTVYDYSTEKDTLLFKLLIANGVTSVVSMGEINHTPKALAEGWGQDTIAIRNNTRLKGTLAPYYFTTGPHLDQSNLKTQDDAIKMVQYHKTRGYDFIKIHGNISQEIYLTLLDEAENAAIPVIGHTQRQLPLEYSLRLSAISHMEDIVMVFADEANLRIPHIDDAMSKDIAKQVKDSGIYISPTVSIFAMIRDFTTKGGLEQLKNRSENAYLAKREYREYTTPGQHYLSVIFKSPRVMKAIEDIFTGIRTLTLAMYKEGVSLLVGSDNIGLQVAGFSMHDEMALLNHIGIPAYDVLKAATITSARYLKRSSSAGTISIGKNAEFIILNSNPIEDIQNTRDIDGVMLKGRWLNRASLDKLLEEVNSARKLEM